MDPEEALEYGFIDKIETYEDVEDSDLSNLFTKEFTNFVELPNRVKEFRNKTVKPVTQVKNTATNKGEATKMPGKTFTEEELTNQIEAAKAEERKRIEALDNLFAPTEEAKNMVNEAKYKAPLSPQEVAYNIMTTDSFKAHREVEEIAGEQKTNGVNNIVTETPKNKSIQQDDDDKANALNLANIMNSARGL